MHSYITRFIGIVCCVSVIGCASSKTYKSASWIPPHAEADWDIASVACDDKASKRQLTPEEIEEANIEKKLSGETVSTASNLHSTVGRMPGGGGIGAVGLGLVMVGGLLGGSADGRKIVEVRAEEFSNCMQDKGWKPKEKPAVRDSNSVQ